MKKIIIGILSASMLCMSTAYASGDFKDISGHWAEGTIKVLAQQGIVNGVDKDTFMPDGNVTRAEYLKMISEVTGVKPAPFRSGECLELKGNEWYAGYVQTALDAGLIPQSMITGFKQNVEYTVDENGRATSSKVITSGAFNGDLTITREEMAVLTQYFYQYTRTVKTNTPTETDKIEDFEDQENISKWAVTSVKQAVANGFIEGMEDNIFKPADTATRAQAATVIFRVMTKK